MPFVISVITPQTLTQLVRGMLLQVYPMFSQTCLFNTSPPQVTSSIAQGGGGSFKSRKAIGEIGCCESRMAERIH